LKIDQIKALGLPQTCLLAVLFFFAAVTAGGQNASLTPPRAGYKFPSNLTLTYTVDWRVFTAGTATLHIENDNDHAKITASADSVGAINMLYPVIDRFQSYFDPRTGCTSGFSKQTQEGRRKVNTELQMQYQQGRGVLNEKNLVSGTGKQQSFPLAGCASDLLSGTFYAASQPLRVGESFTFPIADGLRTVNVTMKVEGREEVRTPLGIYKTVRVQPTASAGVVKNRGNIWIWYTDDERHLPVQMRARLFWGTITFRLAALESKEVVR
jgi:hypothetical protein